MSYNIQLDILKANISLYVDGVANFKYLANREKSTWYRHIKENKHYIDYEYLCSTPYGLEFHYNPNHLGNPKIIAIRTVIKSSPPFFEVIRFGEWVIYDKEIINKLYSVQGISNLYPRC